MAGPQAAVSATPVQNQYQSAATSVAAMAIGIALTFPGAIRGAVLAAGLWQLTRTPRSIRSPDGLRSDSPPACHRKLPLVLGWPWHLAFQMATGTPLIGGGSAIARSALTEVALGPTLALLVAASRALWYRTLLGQAHAARGDMTRKAKALQRSWPGPDCPVHFRSGRCRRPSRQDPARQGRVRAALRSFRG